MASIAEGEELVLERGGAGGTGGRRARQQRGDPRVGLSPRPLNWGMLALFLLFTGVLGVRTAEAMWDWTKVAGCASACTAMWVNLPSSLVCAGCLVQAGIDISDVTMGDDYPMGWACAKADIGC